MLLLLVGPRVLHAHLPKQAEEQGHGISGKLLPRMRSQAGQDFCMGLRTVQHNGHTPSTAVVVRQLDSVDVGFLDRGVQAQGLGNLGRRDVLALPAECVADPVTKVDTPVAIPS